MHNEVTQTCLSFKPKQNNFKFKTDVTLWMDNFKIMTVVMYRMTIPHPSLAWRIHSDCKPLSWSNPEPFQEYQQVCELVGIAA